MSKIIFIRECSCNNMNVKPSREISVIKVRTKVTKTDDKFQSSLVLSNTYMLLLFQEKVYQLLLNSLSELRLLERKNFFPTGNENHSITDLLYA